MKKIELQVVYKSDKYYWIATGSDGGYYIDVIVGGIAMYDVFIKLNDDEIAKFNSIGNLDDLAYGTAKGEYKSRMIEKTGFVV